LSRAAGDFIQEDDTGGIRGVARIRVDLMVIDFHIGGQVYFDDNALIESGFMFILVFSLVIWMDGMSHIRGNEETLTQALFQCRSGDFITLT